jgi:ACT domain-containing protein
MCSCSRVLHVRTFALPSAKLEMITACVRQLSMESMFKYKPFLFLFNTLLQRSGHRCALWLEDLEGMTR